MKPIRLVLAIPLLLALGAPASARDQVRIVGSSTVFPFATTVAEQFGKTTRYKTPVVESTGSGGGLKLFCTGVGLQYPDITNASRRIKSSEVEGCASHGVTEIVEIEIGYDGIVVANSKRGQPLSLTLKDLFLALAKDVPVNGELQPNPHELWSHVNPALPAVKIEVLGPPPTSGTRDAFVELAMEGGAKAIPTLAELRKRDKKAFQRVAHAIREDGAYIEAGENDNLIVQKLEVNPSARLTYTIPRKLSDIGAHALKQYNGERVEYTEGIYVGYRWLDKEGIALRSCGWIWAKNHEPRGCIGCHEDGELTPANRLVEALTRSAASVCVPSSEQMAIDFRRDVMPIVSARCTGCHAAGCVVPDPAGIGLAHDDHAHRVYQALLAAGSAGGDSAPVGDYVHMGRARTSPLVWHLFGRNTSRPWDGPWASRPVKPIPPDSSAPIPVPERSIIVEWIDLGARWDGGPSPRREK